MRWMGILKGFPTRFQSLKTGATRQVAKWEAAQFNVRRLGEKLALQKLQSELEGYTTATAEAKAELSQAQAALAAVQQQLANVPAQTKAATTKLQDQLETLGRENEKLHALGQAKRIQFFIFPAEGLQLIL